MTCGQFVARECSFCVTMTLAFAKYNSSKECFRQSVLTRWSGTWRSMLTREHIQSVANFDTPAGLRLMVWAFFTLGTNAVSSPVSHRQIRENVLFNFSFTGQYWHMSTSCGLRFSGTRSVLLETHQHFGSISFRLRHCSRVDSQPIHTTRKFKLDSV